MAFKLEERQKESINAATKRINLWHGAVRSGKTIASLIAFLKFVLQYVGSAPLLVSGKTERTIERNIMIPLEELVGESLSYSVSKGEGELFGVKLLFAGANDAKSEGKVRGLTAGGGYGDEITLWPMEFFKMWMTRHSVKGAQVFLSTNPDSPYHYVKKDYIDNTELSNFADFHFKLSDNTTLDSDYVESLKQENRGLWKKRFIDGLWVMAEGAVYDCYSEKFEVENPPFNLNDPQCIKVVSCDYGTSNATCFLKVYILMDYKTGKPKSVYIDDCYYWDSKAELGQKSDAHYADAMIKFIGREKFNYIFVDPSALSFIVELQGRGLIVTQATNDVLDGIRFVYSVMSAGILFINSKTCRKLIEQLTGYIWDRTAQIRGEDAPLKVNDHSCDTLRYALYSVFYQMKNYLNLMRSMRG